MNYLELMRSGQSLDPAATQSVLHTCTLLLHALIIQYSNSMYVDAQICTVLLSFQVNIFCFYIQGHSMTKWRQFYPFCDHLPTSEVTFLTLNLDNTFFGPPPPVHVTQ